MLSPFRRSTGKKISFLLPPIALAFASAAMGSTMNVTYDGQNGWNTYADPGSSSTFVSGPATPPIGTGSNQQNIGPNGNNATDVDTANYNGVQLSSLSTLSYSSYQQQNNGSQAIYLILSVNQSGTGTTDNDDLFFEPVYQNGAYHSTVSNSLIPNQCPGGGTNCAATGQWENWNALEGGFWSNRGTDSTGPSGPPLVTLSDYESQYPNATIVGLYLAAGQGATAWANFIGNVDNFQIAGTGPNGAFSDTVNFDPPTATPEPASFALMGSGLLLAGVFAKLRKRKA